MTEGMFSQIRSEIGLPFIGQSKFVKVEYQQKIILIPIMSENMLIINLLGTFLFIQKIILEIYCGNQFFSSYNGLIWQKSLY